MINDVKIREQSRVSQNLQKFAASQRLITSLNVKSVQYLITCYI